jgi:hypothetical protein
LISKSFLKLLRFLKNVLIIHKNGEASSFSFVLDYPQTNIAQANAHARYPADTDEFSTNFI